MNGYGKAFVRYRDAERHRRQTKQYDKALEIYPEIAKEFPDTIWADAAGFYTAQCHFDQGDLRMAAQLWRRFIDADPNGLYRGEALIRLADLALEHDLNPKRAIERYQQAIDWLDTIEEWDKTNDVKRVEERARQVSAAAPGKHGFDDWGNYVVADNRIGALINRATTSWYLPQLRYDARLKMGMALATAGRDQEAHAAFKDLEKYDLSNAYDKDKPWDTISQRLAKGAANQGPRGENEYLKAFHGQHRVAAYLGNLYYDALEWDQSRVMYRRLLDGTLGPLSLDEEAYCVYMMGNIEHMDDNEQGAIDHLRAFDTKAYRKTAIYARGLYTYGAVACQYRMRSEDYENTWQRIFPQVIRVAPDSPEAEKALFYLAYALDGSGRGEQAVPLYRKFLTRYPNSPYIEIVRDHLKELEQ